MSQIKALPDSRGIDTTNFNKDHRLCVVSKNLKRLCGVQLI